MLNPIEVSEKITDEFVSYLSTYFHIADENYAKQFVDRLNEKGVVAKGSYLDITDSFETGENIETLISKGEMSPLFRELEKNSSEKDKEIKLERKLYSHQEKAVLRVNKNRNLVVTTGTGSGKTECFILPIINHLLWEKENGTLNSGVRAILIYPMNALANDQMKRLRLILKDYPDITFGVYNSGTQETDDKGKAEYNRIFKDGNGKAIDPLPNEKISRTSMRENPPHILVTNYAMLEYMLLRPNDDRVFSNSKLKFLVLDEAHIYRGAKGIETSLLLRRLKARIANANDIIHILTSATLGDKESDGDILTFAQTLCDAEFHAEDIIRSKTVMPAFPESMMDYPPELFAELANPKETLNAILDKYNIDYDKNLSDEKEILYNLCLSSNMYKALRKAANEPLTVKQIASRMKKDMDIDEKDIVNLISVALKAEKSKTALIKARYHMFVRALEGAYITLGDTDMAGLTLTRAKYTKDGRRIFEAAVCDDCGRIGIAGKRLGAGNVRELVFANNRWDDDIEFFLLKKENDEWYEDEGEEETVDKNDYIVCAKCGKIAHESIINQNVSLCDCGAEYMIKVRKTNEKNMTKCPCCNSGQMKLFYIGYDAATAVLGTELFEQLPEREAKLEIKIDNDDVSENLFAAAVTNPNAADVVNKKRQFLSFSDSRSEAAFFACYMTNFYKEFLRRRGIWHIINENKENMDKNPWGIAAFAQKLTAFFDANRTFAEPGEANSANLTPISETQAWIAVLNEMVNAKRATSLVSLGVINFVYKGNSESIMNGVANKYKKDVKDVTSLFNLLVMDIVYNGAIEGKDKNGKVVASISNDDREYIYFTASKRRFVKQKGEKEKGKDYLHGWLPALRGNGNDSYYKNNRVRRVMQVLGIDETQAINLLSGYWDNVLMKGTFKLEPDENGNYYIGTDKFEVRAGTENTPIYICDKCKRPTMINCQDRCISINCDGKLKRISHEEMLENNHYARLYAADNMKPLYIKEHTAQLGKSEQQKYQEMFVKKEINALSCSTTFEMGVDVGDLETVYLRNMPPSPANYTQRAGRAGRSLDSAAYVLTYAKLSSHDFTYFANPERMILGKINAPMFNIENPKIIYRHIFAVALSDFFSLHKDVYNGNNADVLLNGDGYERLIKYLNEKPKGLKDILKRSIPKGLHQTMGIDDFSWVEKLIGDEGVLKIAIDDFKETIAFYEKEIESLSNAGEFREAGKVQEDLKFYRRNKDDQRGNNELIEFLVRNNVLPKYGFPVDTVELYPNINWMQGSGVNMVRDLQMAIAEYAPDAEVVADGKLYTSRYIRKLPAKTGQTWEEAYIAECRSCQTWNYSRTAPADEGKRCISCDEVIEKARWKKAIEPRKGFIADFKPKDVHLKKPEHSYKSDDYYIGDPMRKVMSKKSFLVDGKNKILMETSTNDSLMVVCKDLFQVCSVCGYATVYNAQQKKEKEEHFNPWGKKCKGSKSIYKLCHAFKTDVVQLVFDSPNSDDKNTMLSVLYALLEGTSYSLDIERSDIKGCLHRITYGLDKIYSIILYDAVAGGAGHVRRLAKDNGETLQKVIKKGIEITKKCNCDPSCYNCLRNYYNQAIHDALNRKKAYTFLEAFSGGIVVDNDDV